MSDSNPQQHELNFENLDAFSEQLYAQPKESQPEQATVEETSEEEIVKNPIETDTLASEDDDNNDSEESAEEADEPVEDDSSVEEEAPSEPKKKNRFQERIDQLNQKAREADERAKALEAKLNETLERLNKSVDEPKEEPKATTLTKVQEGAAPDPDAKGEDGSALYPLGEYDPNYIKDLTRYTLKQEQERIRQEYEQEQKQKELETQRIRRDEEWNQKLAQAKETEYPDIFEKASSLRPVLETLEPQFIEYISSTIMSLDDGVDVLYYLASNPTEAEAILRKGPTGATIALGRIEAQLPKRNKPKTSVRVSKAPEPPERLNKGNLVSKDIPDDTDDLDAFMSKLYPKNSRRR